MPLRQAVIGSGFLFTYVLMTLRKKVIFIIEKKSSGTIFLCFYLITGVRNMQVNVNVHISSPDIVCDTLTGVGFFANNCNNET